MQTSLRGIAKEAKLLLYEANIIEEPCARKPHVGIWCATKAVRLGTVGKMEEGPPATISRSGCQTPVSCVDKESRW